MKFRVEITDSATCEVEGIHEHIASHSRVNADRWRDGLYSIASTLETFPEGCSLAPENDVVPFEVRQKFYGQYRILFTIVDDRAIVLHVRHGARRPLSGSKVMKPDERRPQPD